MLRYFSTSLSLISILLLIGVAFAKANNTLILESRKNTVKIEAPDVKSIGTGFFVDALHVVTCFHVVSTIDVTPPNVRFQISQTINVVLSDGESIPATCISIPTQQDASPIIFDFAILKLSRKPKLESIGLPIFKGTQISAIGDDILFSGYPFGVPVALTHQGVVSGISDDQSIICLQAPVNKGNSGGALLNEKGEVIGIVSNREGGISQGLDNVTKKITDLEEGRSGVRIKVQTGGIDSLAVTKELITTLNNYISTGIGYARSIKFLREYLEKNPKLLND